MITPTEHGVEIDVRVVPRARRSALDGIRQDAFLIRLAAPPVDGAANEALVTLLADLLNVPKRSITITSGEKGRQKRVAVAGIDAAYAAARLAPPA